MKKILALSLSLAKAEFKLRNEGSYLGIIWYLLNPLLLFILLLLVFSDRLGNDIPHYPTYLLLGIVMFNFFHQTTLESTWIIRNSAAIIKSVKIPLQAFIGSIVLKNLFSHIFEIVIFIIFLFVYSTPVYNIIFYPIILFFFCLFVYGVSLVLSSISVYFVDLKNIWAFASLLIWFATPIFYSIGGQIRLLIFSMFNPMYFFMTISRDIIVYSRMPRLWMIGLMLIYTLLMLLAGLIVFNKLKKKFAEMV